MKTHCDDCDWTFDCWSDGDKCRKRPPSLASSVGSLMRAATLAVKLNDTLDSMKRLHGDDWPTVSAKVREVVQSHIDRNPKLKLMEIVLRLAQRADADGKLHVGVLFLAVGAEMASENDKAVAGEASPPAAG